MRPIYEIMLYTWIFFTACVGIISLQYQTALREFYMSAIGLNLFVFYLHWLIRYWR